MCFGNFIVDKSWSIDVKFVIPYIYVVGYSFIGSLHEKNIMQVCEIVNIIEKLFREQLL